MRIAVEMYKVAVTKRGEKIFGRTRRKQILREPAPRALADSV